MAKKKLNKKVILIGSVVFVFLGLAAIGVILHLSRDPEKFIKDGDAAMQAADEAIDEQIKTEEYDRAARNYLRARARAKTDSLRIEILFKLVDVYLKAGAWNNVRACWNAIIRIDPKNIKARYGLLEYFYIMAESYMSAGVSVSRAWQEIESQTSEFIEVVEDTPLLMEDTAQWESFEIQQAEAGRRRLGPYLYLLRGKALLEITKMGAVTDPDESLARAVDDLEKVREFEPNNVDVYLYLAQADIAKGELLASRGNLEEKNEAVKRAGELLEQAVEIAGADAKAHINLLTMKPVLAQMSVKEQIQLLEPEYLSLVERFNSSAEAFSALAKFYQLSPKHLDKAIEAAEKAVELDEKNVVYAISLARLYYGKFSIDGQKTALLRAIEVAKNALTLPGARDELGPRRWASKRRRIGLYAFLANCYIEQILEPFEIRTESQKQQWMSDAEQAVHEIEQLVGSGEKPQVLKWRGMLELARGDKSVAVRKLYTAYEQLKASGRADAQLSYTLAKIFKDTYEVGAVREFLMSALRANIAGTKPEAHLDYAEVLLKFERWMMAMSSINIFEENFGPNERSRALRIRTYIAAKQFDKAEQELAKSELDDPNAIQLNLELAQAKIAQVRRAIAQKRIRESGDVVSQGLAGAVKEDVALQSADELMAAELKGYRDDLAGLVENLLPEDGLDSVREASIAAVCNYYITERKIEQAKDLVNRFLEHFPDHTTLLAYKQILSDPEVGKLSLQRRKEIRENVLSNISDPTHQAMSLGVFYRNENEPNKAAEQFKKVLKIEALQGDIVEGLVFDQNEEIADTQRLAAGYLFETALGMEDWELAGQIVEVARRENLDACEGHFFAARLAMTKGEYKDALVELDECLKYRPLYSRIFMLRSRVNAVLGNEHASVEDIQKAAYLNPLDASIARELARALYQRNQKLGDNVSSDQIIETRVALEKAIMLNRGDFQLLNFYAEYISSTEPLRALAIRQRLQRGFPSVENALSLGSMATRMAREELRTERKEALYNIAASAFEQARALDPQNKSVIESYAEYYRLTGQREKAEELLAQSQDKKMLWAHYFRAGRFDDAREVLEQLYQTDAKDSDVLRGLLLVAERTADKDAIVRYSEEILALEDSVENRLTQIQFFLTVGLVKEAEYKLQSFEEKYPDEPRSLLLKAWLAMRQGRLKSALELTNRSLESDQDNAIAWRLRGGINVLMANSDQAIIDLKRSKSLSNEPVTQLTLAKAYLQAGRGEDAITELKSVIERPGVSVEGRKLLERTYLQLGRREALIEFYRGTLEEFPDSVFWYNRAGGYLLATGNFSEAEQLYRQAWEKGRKGDDGDVAEAFNGYLQSLLLEGKLDKVLEEAGKYVDGDFASIAFLGMAEAKLKLGDKATAAQYCQKAIDKAGTDESFESWVLQRVYLLIGAEEVLESCRGKLEANPESLAANYTMYSLMRISGEYNKAISYVDKCLEIVGPNDPRAVGYLLGKAAVLQLAYDKTSDINYLKKAVAGYESLLTRMPNNTSVLNNLAYMLAENNERLGKALEYAKRAYEISPNNAGFLDTYAYVLYKNGKYSEAVEFLQAALQQFEQSDRSAPSEVYEHLGMIKEGLGVRAEALAAYRRALEAGAGRLSEAANERITSAIERLSQQVDNEQIEKTED